MSDRPDKIWAGEADEGFGIYFCHEDASEAEVVEYVRADLVAKLEALLTKVDNHAVRAISAFEGEAVVPYSIILEVHRELKK